MSPTSYSQQIRDLTQQAMEASIPVTQIIGTLEIAKLNVDRIMVDMARQHEAKKIIQAMPRINGAG
jgi:hypothetical protein